MSEENTAPEETKPKRARPPKSEPEVEQVPVCGHVNLHAPDPQTCTKAPGHQGNHTAPYKRFIANTNPKEYEDAIAEWSDLAGEPREELVARHDAEMIQLAEERRKKNQVVIARV